MQGIDGTGAEPLRLDELREERVYGSVAEFLQIRESQALGRDRVLSVQVSRKRREADHRNRRICESWIDDETRRARKIENSTGSKIVSCPIVR